MASNLSTDGKEKQAPQGITAISVQGYKSLYDETRVEIRPLTLLAGANSSGKSSIMQPLLLMKQTLEATYDPGPLLIHGPNVRFTSSEQLFSRLVGIPPAGTVCFGLQIDESAALTTTYRNQPRRGVDLAEMTFVDPGRGETLMFRPNLTHDEIASLLPSEFVDYQKRRAANGEDAGEWNVERVRCFFMFGLRYTERTPGSSYLQLVSPAPRFEEHITRLIHVPGLRGNPERTYRTTAVGTKFPGTFENYVASVVSHWQAARDSRLRNLGTDLEALGLTWKVEARQVDDTQVELRVGRLPHGTRGGARDLVSIADVGFGVSQTLPVLVALLAAEPGQMVYLEQPEIHLHPRAQAALAQVLADAAIRGVRVVAETHSAALLLAVQALVAEGKLPPGLVKLHWFERGQDGATIITSADLDDAGAFGEAWPEDFADVSLELQSRYLDAAEAHWEAR